MSDSNGHGQDDVIDVAICDKSLIVQSGLRVLFDENERCRVVALEADGERFLAAVEHVEPSRSADY